MTNMITEISADDIGRAMAEDAVFASEMWIMLADRLNMGVMQDDFCTMVSGMDETKAKWLIHQFRETFKVSESFTYDKPPGDIVPLSDRIPFWQSQIMPPTEGTLK